jgi:microsomal dipeptidase-like Zn-dependent dipeptidase
MWTAFAASLPAIAADPGDDPVTVEPIDEPAPPEVRGQIDWQAHPAMHLPWPMFRRGLTDRPLAHRTWRHQFRQTVSAATLGDSDVRVFLAAAMAAERAQTPKQARRLILRQFAYVERFVDDHPDDYALARTPEQARDLLETTDKMVIVHSIEGGEKLLFEPGDAAFWADQGVAVFTLIHLRDKEFGGSALLEGGVGRLVNPRGTRAARRGERRGLTEHGAASLVALHDAGVLVDLTHMSPASQQDALDLCVAHSIPPLFTHSTLARVHDGSFAVSDEQLVTVYQLGGQFSVSLNGLDLTPERASIEADPDMCPGTLEAWAWQVTAVQQTLRDQVPSIFGQPDLTFDDLSDAQRTLLATGWSSDWNGWTSHSAPVYGRGRCRGPAPDEALPIDTLGLAHPGLLPELWVRVEERGVDLDPMLRSAERFLQLWACVRAGGPCGVSP